MIGALPAQVDEDTLVGGWITWLPSLLDGLWLSLEVAVVSLILGIPIGLGLALLVSATRKWVRVVAIIVVEVGRGTPALVMLQIVYFGLPSAGITVGSFVAAVVALALTTGAYTSEILRGGAWIGVLERAAVFAAIVAGWPEGIAIVLAVKSLARYPELQAGAASAAAERFIIGTFVSTLFAAGCAGLAVWVRATVA